MIGMRFARLVVIEMVKGRTVVRCRCDCGTIKIVRTSDLRGTTKSCGCFTRDRVRAMNARHGEAHRGRVSPEWRIWRSMRQRCTDPNHKSWPRYGGRGITVCERWAESFDNFLADMGRRPPGLTIERRDNELGYSPENCVWATPSDQAKNRAPRSRLGNGTFAPARAA